MKTLVLHPDYQIHVANKGNIFSPEEFNDFSKKQTKAYNQCINSLNLKYGKDTSWWALSTSSRNIFFSQFFLNWCYFHYAKELIKEKKIDLIICENKGILKALKSDQLFRDTKIVLSPQALKVKLKQVIFLKLLISIFQFLKYNIKLKLSATNTNSLNPQHFKKNIRLIDVFVTEGTIKEEQYTDCYFGDFVSESNLENWTYLPSLYEIKDLKKCFTILRKNKTPFIIKEDFLKISDYIKTIIISLPLWFKKFSHKDFNNLTPLINYDIKFNFNANTLNSLLVSYLPLRLQQNNIKVSHYLDWHEAQPYDNIVTKSFAEAYNNIKISHYVGALFSRYQGISYQAISSQIKFKTIGESFYLQGPSLTEMFTSIKGLEYKTAPAFRIKKPACNETSEKKEPLLVVLPNMLEQSVEIIDFIHEASLKIKKITFSIHPRTNLNFIRNYIQEKLGVTYSIKFTQNLTQEIKAFQLIISTGTTAFVDGFQYNIPCIVVGSRSKLTLNFIPEEFESKLFRQCYAPSQLESVIQESFSLEKNDFSTFLKNYTTLPSPHTIKQFSDQFV
tara:strand:+ start:131355 stop:133034 length:1680 start_codon:yes stop_codon:yes gene_type:complete